MYYAVVWVIFAVITGMVGNNRTIGFAGAFLIALLASPVVGLIFAFDSEKKTVVEFRQKALEEIAYIRAMHESLFPPEPDVESEGDL